MSCHVCGYPSVLKCQKCGKSICARHYDYPSRNCVPCRDKQPEVETKPAFAPETKPMLPESRKGGK